MRIVKWLVGILAVYALFVFAFEAFFLGMVQPKLEGTGVPMLVLTTTDEAGVSRERRLAKMETDGRIYVSAHHWPRGWYKRALANPAVQVDLEGAVGDYVAVPVEGAEHDRVAAEWPLPLPVLFLMGFPPPREILRLDPAPTGTHEAS